MRGVAAFLLVLAGCGTSIDTATYAPCPNCAEHITMTTGASCVSALVLFDEKGRISNVLSGSCEDPADLLASPANSAILGGVEGAAMR